MPSRSRGGRGHGRNSTEATQDSSSVLADQYPSTASVSQGGSPTTNKITTGISYSRT